MTWNDDQKWESNWWGDCVNTFWEETKQIVYARKMGLKADNDNGKYPVYNAGGRCILDIGGGPVSMLLKTVNFNRGTVIDPCDYPKWTLDRYAIHKIDFYKIPGEELAENIFTITGEPRFVYDEIWIYNVLQHTIDPELIIASAKKHAEIIRLFEWVDEPISIGHPQLLTEQLLNKWLGGVGKTENINENGCHGRCYYGVFLGDNYEKI